MVATTGAVPVFTAVKAGILPVSPAAKPIEVVLFVQLYTIVPPVAVLAKGMAADNAPLHTTLLVTAVTTAFGLTVMVKVEAVPAQLIPPLVNVGVTVMVATTGANPAFTAVKAAMFPTPLAAKPMEAVLFVQLYTIVPSVVGLAKVTSATVDAVHTTLLDIVVTVAFGFTVKVKVEAVPVQLTAPLV